MFGVNSVWEIDFHITDEYICALCVRIYKIKVWACVSVCETVHDDTWWQYAVLRTLSALPSGPDNQLGNEHCQPPSISSVMNSSFPNPGQTHMCTYNYESRPTANIGCGFALRFLFLIDMAALDLRCEREWEGVYLLQIVPWSLQSEQMRWIPIPCRLYMVKR